MAKASGKQLVCLNHSQVDGHVQSSVQNNPRFENTQSHGTQVSQINTPIRHTVKDSDIGRLMYKHTHTHTQRRMTVICCDCLVYFSSFWRPSCCVEYSPTLTTITTPSLIIIKAIFYYSGQQWQGEWGALFSPNHQLQQMTKQFTYGGSVFWLWKEF